MGFVELAVALKATLVEITHQYRSDNRSVFGGQREEVDPTSLDPDKERDEYTGKHARGRSGDLRYHRRSGEEDDFPLPVPVGAPPAARLPDRRRCPRRLVLREPPE